MKNIITPKTKFGFVLLLLCMCVSNTTFAQRDAGGSSGGQPPQPCPTSFTRNNGDGSCGGEAQIRLYYSTPPTTAPTLQTILYNGAPLYDNMTPVVGDLAGYATKGYISFCLPSGNIPPAIKLTLVIYYTDTTQQECTISGTQ